MVSTDSYRYFSSSDPGFKQPFENQKSLDQISALMMEILKPQESIDFKDKFQNHYFAFNKDGMITIRRYAQAGYELAFAKDKATNKMKVFHPSPFKTKEDTEGLINSLLDRLKEEKFSFLSSMIGSSSSTISSIASPLMISTLSSSSSSHISSTASKVIPKERADAIERLQEWNKRSPKKKEKFTLIDLDLSKDKEVTDATLAHFPRLKDLKSINLSGSQITDHGLNYLPRTLASINLSKCRITDEGLQSLPLTLISLNLSGCEEITDDGLDYLPKTLTSINLSGCHITNKGLTFLPLGLNYLNLSRCEEITDDGLDYLIMFSALKSLKLTQCKITSEGLRHIPESVEFLDLSKCENITHFSHLNKNIIFSLILSECNSVLDKELETIPNYIRQLDLSKCKITDKGLEYLPPKLTFLKVSGCPNITTPGITKFQKRLPKCRIIN